MCEQVSWGVHEVHTNSQMGEVCVNRSEVGQRDTWLC